MPRVEGKPLWKLLADMEPEQIVRAIDFTYITDAITKEGGPRSSEKKRASCKGHTPAALAAEMGYPAY